MGIWPTKELLDFLQTKFPVRLDPASVPSVLRSPFERAVVKFNDPIQRGKIDQVRMGICEEVGDLAYQTLKMICIASGILTEENIGTLQDYLRGNGYYDDQGRLIDLDYLEFDALGYPLVSKELVGRALVLLPEQMFRQNGDQGFTLVRDFLAGQFAFSSQ